MNNGNLSIGFAYKLEQILELFGRSEQLKVNTVGVLIKLMILIIYFPPDCRVSIIVGYCLCKLGYVSPDPMGG